MPVLATAIYILNWCVSFVIFIGYSYAYFFFIPYSHNTIVHTFALFPFLYSILFFWARKAYWRDFIWILFLRHGSFSPYLRICRINNNNNSINININGKKTTTKRKACNRRWVRELFFFKFAAVIIVFFFL